MRDIRFSKIIMDIILLLNKYLFQKAKTKKTNITKMYFIVFFNKHLAIDQNFNIS